MNLENQTPDSEFEIMFLMELIKMCSDNGFIREANALNNILNKIEVSANAKIIWH